MLKPVQERPPSWTVIKFSNEVFQRKVDFLQGARDILRLLGYKQEMVDEGGRVIGLLYPETQEPNARLVLKLAADLCLAKFEVEAVVNGTHPMLSIFKQNDTVPSVYLQASEMSSLSSSVDKDSRGSSPSNFSTNTSGMAQGTVRTDEKLNTEQHNQPERDWQEMQYQRQSHSQVPSEQEKQPPFIRKQQEQQYLQQQQQLRYPQLQRQQGSNFQDQNLQQDQSDYWRKEQQSQIPHQQRVQEQFGHRQQQRQYEFQRQQSERELDRHEQHQQLQHRELRTQQSRQEEFRYEQQQRPRELETQHSQQERPANEQPQRRHGFENYNSQQDRTSYGQQQRQYKAENQLSHQEQLEYGQLRTQLDLEDQQHRQNTGYDQRLPPHQVHDQNFSPVHHEDQLQRRQLEHRHLQQERLADMQGQNERDFDHPYSSSSVGGRLDLPRFVRRQNYSPEKSDVFSSDTTWVHKSGVLSAQTNSKPQTAFPGNEYNVSSYQNPPSSHGSNLRNIDKTSNINNMAYSYANTPQQPVYYPPAEPTLPSLYERLNPSVPAGMPSGPRTDLRSDLIPSGYYSNEYEEGSFQQQNQQRQQPNQPIDNYGQGFTSEKQRNDIRDSPATPQRPPERAPSHKNQGKFVFCNYDFPLTLTISFILPVVFDEIFLNCCPLCQNLTRIKRVT